MAILACDPATVRLCKEFIIRWRNLDQRAAIEAGLDAFARAYETPVPRDAVTAFLEKRPPRFAD